MKWIIALTAVFCVSLIAVGWYFAVNSGSSGPRLVPMDKSYQQRLDSGKWEKGNPKAPVVVTEFADFQCPACRQLYISLNEALSQTQDVARFEYREYPLNIHDKSMLAAKAAEAAGRQGQFWQMYALLYGSQTDWSSKTPFDFRNDCIGFARDTLKLNVEQFKQDLDDSTLQDPIDKDMTAGNAISLQATPTILINGKQVENLPTDTAEIVKLIRGSIPAN